MLEETEFSPSAQSGLTPGVPHIEIVTKSPLCLLGEVSPLRIGDVSYSVQSLSEGVNLPHSYL